MLSRLYKGDGWGGLISTANQKFQKKLRQISHDESPGGAAERSPARKCWECPDFANKPRRGDTLWRPRIIELWSRVSPLRACPLQGPVSRVWRPGLRSFAPTALSVVRNAGQPRFSSRNFLTAGSSARPMAWSKASEASAVFPSFRRRWARTAQYGWYCDTPSD